ncbi:MAG: tetratricopeptide repeat protein [Planctomycetales bacterium]|nr:tetratricopeptide repeat protein [Planctomycetales bacterium]
MSFVSDPQRPAGMPRPTGYVPAVSPRLKKLLIFVLVLVALLGANSVYLSSITWLEWKSGLTYQNYFYQLMFLAHLVLGLLLILPFLVFGVAHMVAARGRRNRRAVRVGYALFAVAVAVLLTGLMLMRIEIGSFQFKMLTGRSVAYWAHVGCPLACGWLYWLHRLAGPRIKWKWGFAYAGLVGAVVAAMVGLHSQDPRNWNVVGPKEGAKYFEPSLVKTSTGNFIPAKTLMMDDSYCIKCHADAYEGHLHSAHRMSSFSNPAYLASVRETRQVSLKRDGNVQASRWCAGCHDPVPFLSGAFDDPKFDDVNHATAHAGITCTVCHAMTHVNSTKGNGDYTIEEPQHYPFAFSDNAILQYVNQQLVKAKPSFHKKTFLKPHHKTAEFCSTCHKVHLPYALNNYKEFLRGQDHYNSYFLSGVSGHGIRSFYYPPEAKQNCAACHMPLAASNDFGARLFDQSGKLTIHDHLFPAANTALPWLRNEPEFIKKHQDFMAGAMRVDVFGVKEGGTVDGKLHAPLRPDVPTLRSGEKYLLESVVRTVKMGHHFTQGTVDSNEVWVEVTATSGGKVIGKSGGIGDDGSVDPWSHFINVYMLDRDGKRIDRRNPQDIFVPLYNHQIPPGAAAVVHYELQLPENLTAPIEVEVKLNYRKFDKIYMDFVTRTSKPGDKPIRGFERDKPYRNELPVTTLASDRIVFPVEGVDKPIEPQKSAIVEADLWQRWNDYGIGLLLEGQTGTQITGRSELRQAEEAFREVEKSGRFDGPLNLARVYYSEGRLDDAVDALRRAAESQKPPAPAWTITWLTGLVNKQQGYLDKSIENFRSALYDQTDERRKRGFDFSLDLVVINELGQTLFERAKQELGDERKSEREALFKQAVEQFERTLRVDSEDVMAHYNLSLLFTQLGDEQQADEHRKLHARYKPDDNAQDRAINLARKDNPAANHAAERLVIYPLNRTGAPGLVTADGKQDGDPVVDGRRGEEQSPANRQSQIDNRKSSLGGGQ